MEQKININGSQNVILISVEIVLKSGYSEHSSIFKKGSIMRRKTGIVNETLQSLFQLEREYRHQLQELRLKALASLPGKHKMDPKAGGWLACSLRTGQR